MYVLLALLYKGLEVSSTICTGGFSSKAYCDRGQHCALTTSVMPNHEVDQRANSNLQETVAHEIGTCHQLYNAIIRRLIVVMRLSTLLLAELTCM